MKMDFTNQPLSAMISRTKTVANVVLVSNSIMRWNYGIYTGVGFLQIDLPVDIDEFIFIKKHKKFDKDTRDNFKLEEKKKIRNLE